MKHLNMADAGMDGQPARNPTLPVIETHWSRILYVDMFAAAIEERASAHHQQRQKARAIRDALGELDDRTPRDLGFQRSEIGSIAPEVTAEAEPISKPAYKHATSRVAVGFAALAMTAVTISCFVIIPARIEDGVYNAGMVAASKIGPVSSLGATMRRLVSTYRVVGAKSRPWL